MEGAIAGIAASAQAAASLLEIDLPDGFLTDLLGFSPEELARANTSIGNALSATWDDTVAAWRVLLDTSPLEIPTPDVEDVGLDASLLIGIDETAIARFRERADELLASVEPINERLQSLAEDAGRAFGRFAISAITDLSNIGDAARRLGQTIIDSLFRQLIVSRLTGAISGALGTFFGGAGSGPVAQLQGGGPALAGTPYIIGEGGPELFVPQQSGTVIPNGALGGLGGATFNFAPVIQGGSGADVEQALARAYPAFEDNIRGSILADLARPSVFSRARSR